MRKQIPNWKATFLMLATIGLISLSGCRLDPNARKIQYMPDMADSPTVKTQEDFLVPPAGAVAMGAPLFPEDLAEASQIVRPEGLVVDAAKGQELYNTFCIPCHGEFGKGNGTVGPEVNYPKPPDLTLPLNRERDDGYFIHRITFGSAVMPSYGYAIDVKERWYILDYLRTLQD